MLDLTGGNLTAYLLREVSEVVGKHPRFRASLGQVTFANNTVAMGNMQCTVKNISTQGTRLSPDYFLFTQYGQAILAKLADKEGMFCEWVQETNPKLLDPGVYCINVDKVTEKTQEVELTVQKYEWRQGRVQNASGSLVYFAAKTTAGSPPLVIPIDTTQLTVTDSALKPVNFVAFPNYIQLTSPVFSPLIITMNVLSPAEAITLVPLTDYWFERQTSVVLIQSTVFGQQLAFIPESFISFALMDNHGFTLRPDIDFSYVPRSVLRLGNNNNWDGSQLPTTGIAVQLSKFTAAGDTISCTGTQKIDPSTASAIASENIIPITLKPGQKLAPDQVIITTSQGEFTGTDLIVNGNGSVQLPIVLGPGESYRWEVRIDCGQTTGVLAKKQWVNDLVKIDADQNGTELSRTSVIPGLWVAIGDSVEVDDQIAIIVSPKRTECYRVYGSKENLTFTLDVKANDLLTASEISELIKAEWTYRNRDNMEADGITIFEISREQTGEQRDASGTAASYTYSLSVTAACDWKGYVPLVTRLADLEITTVMNTELFGKMTYASRLQVLGAFQFMPIYS